MLSFWAISSYLGGFENFCRSLHKTEAMTEIFNCGMKKWNNAKISIICMTEIFNCGMKKLNKTKVSIICMLTQFNINIQFSFISSHFYSKQACSVENKA